MLFYIRLFIYGIYFVLTGIFILIVMMLRPFNPKNVKFAMNIWGYACFKIFGIEVEIRGKEFLEMPESPKVYLSNHQSNWDFFLVGTHVPLKCVAVGKDEIKWFPILGPIFWLSGSVLINRKDSKEASKTIEVIVNALKLGIKSIFFFPEGTRSRGKGLQVFKKGAFVTALQAQCDIVPIAVSSYYKHLNFNRWRAGKVVLQALPPISVAGLQAGPREIVRLKDESFNRVKTALAELDVSLYGA